ncbi:MAG: nitronate monooxygenase family protein [Turicibacter sp.]|nr:nitronate monooxygenase family protein [Turicibacter sp.]
MSLLAIKDKILEVPIIQGGMGVGVSLGNLAGAVMAQGGMGTISAANPGFMRAEFRKKSLTANLEQFAAEIKKAREMAKGRGVLAVNIMVASSTYVESVKQAVKSKVDAIVSGAGLPLELPALVKGSGVAIAPIVSSGRAATVICRSWLRKHEVLPDFVVVEGPDAGGHLGFSQEELAEGSHKSLKEILADVKEALQPFAEKAARAIPIFVAGGIYTGRDIAEYVKAGATGVQMGTRFIGTHECDASDEYKAQFLQASEADIILTKSPAGLPGRAINNPFTKRVAEGRVAPNWCINCLQTCHPKETPYCISEALINAVTGKADEGLIFTGTNGWRITDIRSVKSLMDELMHEYALHMGGLING